MNTYLIWNPDKVSNNFGLPFEQQNILTIRQKELTEGVLSSTILAEDEIHTKNLVEAFCNETDVNIEIAHLPKTYTIAVYDTANYSDYYDAESSGAVYTIKDTRFTEEQLLDPSFGNLIQNTVATASNCKVDDAFGLEVVILNPETNDLVSYLYHLLPRK